MAHSLKVYPPKRLEPTGVSAVDFKAWRSVLYAYLEQDPAAHLFLRGGAYSSWSAISDANRRISSVAIDDPNLVDLQLQIDAGSASEDVLPAAQADLVIKRNAQVSKFLILICCLIPHELTYDVTQLATSFEWIFRYLEEFYGIRKQGARFLKISDITYGSTHSRAQFFITIRQALTDSLRKAGDVVVYRDNKRLENDETIGPSFDNFIVLYWLEKIDPRLPKKFMYTNVFGHI